MKDQSKVFFPSDFSYNQKRLSSFSLSRGFNGNTKTAVPQDQPVSVRSMEGAVHPKACFLGGKEKEKTFLLLLACVILYTFNTLSQRLAFWAIITPELLLFNRSEPSILD